MLKVKQKKEETSRQCKVLRLKIKYMNMETTVLDPNSDRYLAQDYDLFIDLTPNAKYRSCVMAVESEVHRALQHLNPNGVKQEGQYRFFEDMFVLDVGKSNCYRWLIKYKSDDKDNPIQINRSPEKQGRITLRYYADKEKTELLYSQTYIHFICNASHVRGQKAWFIREDLFDKADEILRCGIFKDKLIPHISKWTSYYGLQASDSIPVTMPRMTCVKDFEHSISDIVDEVTVTEEVDYSKKKSKVEKKYTVTNAVQRDVKTMPFDGMGICDISIAEVWAKDLGLDYIPGSFQIRLCGVKGCLFVMDVKKFIREKNGGNSIIINADGDKCDYIAEDINVILTDSMFKYGKFYDDAKPFARWLEEFAKECHGYHRTFNICDYAKDITQLKDKMVTAYQPLQSLPNLTDDDIKEFCKPTIEKIKKMGKDVDVFLEYLGVDEDKAEQRGSFLPPYYRGLYYNRSLVNDPYVKGKLEASIKRAIEASYTGKLIVDGNYTVVCSDPYALLEWVFSGGDKSKVRGLLGGNEIYSNYWNRKGEQTVTVWRNPHIYTEHQVSKCRSDEECCEWFKYLHSNIVVSVWDTNLLRFGGADCDGDTLGSCKNTILEAAVINRDSHTILPNLSAIKKGKPESEYLPLGDIVAQVESEMRGFKNDIGTCTNQISHLWGLIGKKTDSNNEVDSNNEAKILDYIKSMSVVDALVIDFPKTGEKIGTPKEIKDFMKEEKVIKPRFMMYLPQNAEKRSEEKTREKEFKQNEDDKGKRAKETGEKYKRGEYKSQLFSNIPCVMNRICEYMKDEFGGKVVVDCGQDGFSYLSLLKSQDDNLKYRPIYQIVKDRFLKLYGLQMAVLKDCRKSIDSDQGDSDDRKNILEAFYSTCRSDLLMLREEGKYVSPDKIIDCCILYAVTYPTLRNKQSIYDMLWNCFSDELVERCQGKFKKELTDEQLKKRAEFIQKTKDTAEKAFLRQMQNIDYIDTLPCLVNKKPEEVSGIFTMYGSDISDVKKAIKSSTDKKKMEKSVLFRRRKLLCALLIFARRIMALESSDNLVVPYIKNSRSKITVNFLSNVIDEDNNRTVSADLEWIADKGLITIGKNKIRINTELFLRDDSKDIVYTGDSCREAIKKMLRLFNK